MEYLWTEWTFKMLILMFRIHISFPFFGTLLISKQRYLAVAFPPAAGHRGAVPSRSGPAAHLKASPILVDLLLVAASKEAETLGVWMGVSRCLKEKMYEHVVKTSTKTQNMSNSDHHSQVLKVEI